MTELPQPAARIALMWRLAWRRLAAKRKHATPGSCAVTAFPSRLSPPLSPLTCRLPQNSQKQGTR